MRGRINSKLGEIQINPEVVFMYAGTMAVECFGTVGMAAASMKDGPVKLLKRENLTHGVNVETENNHITIDFHVIIAYGMSTSAVADNLIENMKREAEEFTDIEVDKIDIYMEGVGVIDQGEEQQKR